MNQLQYEQWDYQWSLPIWLTLLIALALFAACWLGYRSQLRHVQDLPVRSQQTLRKQQRTPWLWIGSLALLRFLGLAMIIWMFAEWSWQPFAIERPHLLWLIDRSASMTTSHTMTAGQPAATRLAEVQKGLPTSKFEELAQRFQIQPYWVNAALTSTQLPWSFDAQPETDANANESRLGEGIMQAVRSTSGEPVAGIVVVTDGINTHGPSLMEAASLAKDRSIPLYFLGVGKRPLQPDVMIREANVESSVFLGDLLLIEAFIQRKDTQNTSFLVTLKDGDTGATLDAQTVFFRGEETEASLPLKWQTASTSLKHLTIEVASFSEEKETENNRLTKSIDVRDAPIPLLYVEGQPSYEYRSLKHLLERTKQPASPDLPAFQLQCVLEDSDLNYARQDASIRSTLPIDAASLNSFDVVILGDVPQTLCTASWQQSLVRYVSEHGGGLMVVAGPSHMPNQYVDSPLAKLLPFDLQRVKAAIDPLPFRWQLTDVGERTMALRMDSGRSLSQAVWDQLPWQRWRWLAIQPTPLAQVLATSHHENQTDPLLLTQFVGAGRVAFQATNETYQWQSHLGDDLCYQRYWIQMIRWLSKNRALQSASPIQIQLSHRRLEASETLRATIQLNPVLQPAAGSQIPVELLKANGPARTAKATLTPGSAGDYVCEFSKLPAGEYRVLVNQGAISVTSDPFEVTSRNDELQQLLPDEKAMRRAAEMSGGQFAMLAEGVEPAKWIRDLGSVKRQPLPKRPFWNHPWVWLSILTCLSLEWALRRSWGLP